MINVKELAERVNKLKQSVQYRETVACNIIAREARKVTRHADIIVKTASLVDEADRTATYDK